MARPCRIPIRHARRETGLRRPVARQPEVPRERAGAGASRPDRAHAWPRRPCRGDASSWRRSSAAPWSRDRRTARAGCRPRVCRRPWSTPANKGGTIEVDGVKITLTNAHHSSSAFENETFVYLGEPCGLVIAAENGTSLYFAGDTCVFGDMKIIGAHLQARRGDPPDRRSLHDGSRRGRCRARAARRQALRPLPLRDVSAPRGDPGRAARPRPGVEVISPEPGETIEL